MGAPYPVFLVIACLSIALGQATAQPLGLPPVAIPADNPQSPEKIRLGEKLFHDKRFSSTGEVSCASCHDPGKAFTDRPLATSEGINKLSGTRNAPTVVNAAYYSLFFWDGRSPNLEDQAQHPIVNPVEMGLASHERVLQVVRTDREYVQLFRRAFSKEPAQTTMKEVQQAIASFERTIVSGDSPFDRWYFGGDKSAIGDRAQRGFGLFTNKGRCDSCHLIEQHHALFTDNRFHNLGVGMHRIRGDAPRLAAAFLEAKAGGADTDRRVLANPKISQLGRFAVTGNLAELGAFKTPTLRNVAVTGPFMHDGSVKTLRDAVEHHGAGAGNTAATSDFASGGIRPSLNLTEEEIADLVAFLETLTSPQFAPQR